MSERLTEKYNDELGITHAKIKENVENKYYRSYRFLPIEQAMLKLAQFEDFMEEMGFEDLQNLTMAIRLSQMMNTVGAKQFAELQANKTRWEKLKECLHTQYKIDDREHDKTGLAVFGDYMAFNNWVLDRMQELEEGGDE